MPTIRELLEGSRSGIEAALKLLPVDEPAVPTTATTPLVRSGDALMQALTDAPPDATIRISPDVRYDGPLALKKPVTLVRDGDISTARMDASTPLPSFGVVMIAAPRVRLIGLEFQASSVESTIVTDIGRGTFLDRCRIVSRVGAHRGILAHGQECIYSRLYGAGINSSNDSQAIVGWDGTKTLLIDDCYLQASGNNVMFGGADSASEDRIPQDIIMQGCTLEKDVTLKGVAGITFKNLFELKAAQHVQVLDNEMRYSWKSGQDGWAIVLTVRNQSGKAPWSTIQDVTIKGNKMAHCGSGVQILGRDDRAGYDSVPMANITIADNECTDLNRTAWGGSGRALMINRGCEGLVVARNRFAQTPPSNAFLVFVSKEFPVQGLQVLQNDFCEGSYGITGDAGTTMGLPTLEAFAPGYVWAGNTVRKTQANGRTIKYPADTTFIPLAS